MHHEILNRFRCMLCSACCFFIVEAMSVSSTIFFLPFSDPPPGDSGSIPPFVAYDEVKWKRESCVTLSVRIRPLDEICQVVVVQSGDTPRRGASLDVTAIVCLNDREWDTNLAFKPAALCVYFLISRDSIILGFSTFKLPVELSIRRVCFLESKSCLIRT